MTRPLALHALAQWLGAALLAMLACLTLTPAATAATDRWVEVTGHAALSGAADQDSARRRALADALFQAALAGGVEVRGHSAMSQAVITADVAIVRAIGRVMDHQILSQRQSGGMWSVTIKARVGPASDPFCVSPRRLAVAAYAPEIRVSPEAPAWAGELAQELARDLVTRLDRHPATDLIFVTDRALPTDSADPGFDYQVLTQGSARLAPGESGFVPVIEISATRGAAGLRLTLAGELRLHEADGSFYRQPFRREAPVIDPPMLGRLAALTRRDRDTLKKALTRGLEAEFAALLDRRACEPLMAQLDLRDGRLVVPVGRRLGLSRAALAFTADRGASTELLEVVKVSANAAELRPLDPGLSNAALAGRTIRFVEARW